MSFFMQGKRIPATGKARTRAMRKWQNLLRMNRKALMECVYAEKDRQRKSDQRRTSDQQRGRWPYYTLDTLPWLL